MLADIVLGVAVLALRPSWGGLSQTVRLKVQGAAGGWQCRASWPKVIATSRQAIRSLSHRYSVGGGRC